jgi:hypothetical protein
MPFLILLLVMIGFVYIRYYDILNGNYILVGGTPSNEVRL